MREQVLISAVQVSLHCFAAVIHRKSLGKGPLVPIGICKKKFSPEDSEDKRAYQMPSAVGGWREQYQVGAGSGAPSLADADPCLPWQAPALEQRPSLIQLCLCTLVATNLQHICSSCTIPAKKSCVQQI